MLQHVAACCSVLQCVAGFRDSVLQCFAVYATVLQCLAVLTIVLQCVAVCCSVLQCAAECYSVLQRAAVCCSVLFKRVPVRAKGRRRLGRRCRHRYPQCVAV